MTDGPDGPPPAAGAAAVGIDEEVFKRLRKLKRAEERQKRMVRR